MNRMKTPLPRTVWILGLVSLFMDMSSEFIHAILPIYLTATLGLSVLAVGIIEGIAEATASMMKVFSGVVSDYFQKRKLLVLIGYGLGALTKPVFPLANSAFDVVTARFVDRIGKGIRGAPRDALIADVTPSHLLKAAYGLRQSLDTVGAFIGPLLAIIALFAYSHDLRVVMWIAVIPAIICLALIVWGLEEPAQTTETVEGAEPAKIKKPRLQWQDRHQLSQGYWQLLGLTALITLARMTDAFLILRAQENGLTLMWIPLVLVIYSLTYALSAYPTGLLANKLKSSTLLSLGMLCLAVAQGLLAFDVGTGVCFWAGIVLWGLHMGLTQGLLTARVAELAPAHLRGTSFGLFHLTTGIAQLIAGGLFGVLWVMYSAAVAFDVALLISLVSALWCIYISSDSDSSFSLKFLSKLSER